MSVSFQVRAHQSVGNNKTSVPRLWSRTITALSFTPDPRQVDLAGLGILVPLLPGLQECQAKLVPILPARSGQRKPSLVCPESYISEYWQKQSKGSVLFTTQRTDICPGCSGAMLWEGHSLGVLQVSRSLPSPSCIILAHNWPMASAGDSQSEKLPFYQSLACLPKPRQQR